MNKNCMPVKKSIFYCISGIAIVLAILPLQLAKAQVSSDIEKKFNNAGIRLLGKRQDSLNFSLPLTDGRNVTLSSYRGKVVILNFWATWCPPCRNEMPSMETLYQRFKNRGLELLAVNLGEDKAAVQQFIRNNKYTFPVLLDSVQKTGRQYGISAIPASYIIDREGKIIARVVGSISWDDPKIFTAFEALLENK